MPTALSAYFQGKKKAITPAVAAPKAPAPIRRAKLHFGVKDIQLKIKPTMNHITKNARPTAKWRGSHRCKKLPSNGPQKPPIKKHNHRHMESLSLLTQVPRMKTALFAVLSSYLFGSAVTETRRLHFLPPREPYSFICRVPSSEIEIHSPVSLVWRSFVTIQS
ncbi:hypothetical protein BH20ACI3_BH20ACI3_09520 [soil metagenome]